MLDNNLKFSKDSIQYVDSTPDNNYPIRILQAYLDNCSIRMSYEPGDGKENQGLKEMFRIMNNASDERARILTEAINILKTYFNQKLH